MPRKLPWDTTQTAKSKAAASPSTPHKRKRPTESNEAERVARSAKPGHGPTRTPSTSPPPQAPSETPMRAADRLWIMVEDEFYATAQLFTNHLHHAEYRRLQALAAKKENRALESEEQPVYGVALKVENNSDRSNASTPKRATGASRSAQSKVRKRLKKEKESTSDDGDIAVGDRNLAKLLSGKGDSGGSNNIATDITGSIKSNTRAAAGFQRQDSHQSPFAKRAAYGMKSDDIPGWNHLGSKPKPMPEDDDDDDDDDLDAPVQRSQSAHVQGTDSIVPKYPASRQPETRPPPTRDKLSSDVLNAGLVDHKSKAHWNDNSKANPPADQGEFKKPPILADLPMPSLGREMLSRRPKKNKKPPKTNDDDDMQHVKLEEIPTFLFS